MALRCTVFGHDWGEPEMERDRREDGEEVVVSVREVRSCRRCGADDVLGESMEVTTTRRSGAEADGETDAGDGRGDAAIVDAASDPETDDGVILEEGGSGAASPPDEDDAERDPREWPEAPGEASEAEPDGAEEHRPWPDPGTGAEGRDDPEADDRFEGPASREASAASDGEPGDGGDDAAVDRADEVSPPDDGGRAPGRARPDEDAELLGEGSSSEGGRAEEAGSGATDPGSEPTDSGPGTAGPGSAAAGDDGERVAVPDAEDGPDGDGAGTDRRDAGGPGAAPEEPYDGESGSGERASGTAADPGQQRSTGSAGGGAGTIDPEDDAELVEETEPNEQSRVTAEAPIDPAPGAKRERDPDRVSETTDPEELEYYCPECGFVDDRTRPTRRAGDVCPECRRSYLAERER